VLSVAKKVKEGIGKHTTDDQGDAHMIASNDLLVRVYTCEECGGSSPADSEHWSRYWLTYFKHQFKGNLVPSDDKPTCLKCSKATARNTQM
jgi:hypothetical protein